MAYQFKSADREWAEGIYEKLKTKLKTECARMGDWIPYIPKNGRYHDLESSEQIFWWTNGFWPGMLWQMYNASKDEAFRKTAESVVKRFDRALELYEGLHHDLGFMWLHTAVADYRLTGNKDSRRNGLHAANLLAGRYNPAGKFIRAWNGDRTGWIIIDCMMNIPLLYWASKEMDDPRFRMIAIDHAHTTKDILVRPDGSCNHIAILSPETGECLELPGGQGYASGSSWTRGQAWGMYGFVLSYLHTQDREFLDTSKKIAHYVIANSAKNDWLPLVDFRAPPEPVKYDSTSAMISACGLLELANQTGEYEAPLYADAAIKLLRTCE
ncbi:MAG: glycoside hydrolase family 88 protein, partial [Treponema sp.]|nr:glycoside hydrolase family 88 protein [Treponema sp.]